jgi:hypothetical protein
MIRRRVAHSYPNHCHHMPADMVQADMFALQ